MSKRLDDLVSDVTKDRPEVDFAAGRRSFMRSMGLGVAGAAALGVAGSATPASATASLDIQILTFALNLEYLEANFYSLAVNGTEIPVALRGGQAGTVTVPASGRVNFQSSTIAAYAKEIAQDEINHVTFLRNTIVAAGLVPASQPNLNLSDSFTTAAYQAGLIKSGQTFDPFASDANFLLASYIFEDVGVTAYHGAAPSITNPVYLDKAAGILATEAYHAGIVRTSLFAMGYASQTQAISYLRSKLDLTAGTPMQGNDHGVGTQANPSIVNADSRAVVEDRSMSQVLRVVYGTSPSSSTPTPGLFFPNGVNMPT